MHSRLKLMFIDNEPDICDIALDKFQNDFEIITFTNPLLAIDAYINSPYDIVICDYLMPQLNGCELIKQLKEIDPQVTIISNSGDITNAKEDMIKAGSFNHIDKKIITLSSKELKREIKKAHANQLNQGFNKLVQSIKKD